MNTLYASGISPILLSGTNGGFARSLLSRISLQISLQIPFALAQASECSKGVKVDNNPYYRQFEKRSLAHDRKSNFRK